MIAPLKSNTGKVPITKAQLKEYEKLIADFRFQDEFITKSLVKLQQQKDPVRYGRLARFWQESKAAMELYAKQGDIVGTRRVVENNQRFIDQVLSGKIKLFEVEPI